MSGKIFISYRRNDSAANALGIGQYLAQEFGRQNIFIDVDIGAGANFPAVLERRLAECKVLLAVIGPNWLDARDSTGNRRLDDPKDWVRLEIVRALERRITVIPVLIDGAELPSKSDLPEDLQGLLDHQSALVTTTRFRTEMGGLARDIRAIPNDRTWRRLAVGSVVLLVLVSAGWIGLRAMDVPISLSWLGQMTVATAPEPKRRAAPEPSGLRINGTSTYHIVRQIRCETSNSIKQVFIAWLDGRRENGVPNAKKLIDQFNNDPASTGSPQNILLKGREYDILHGFIQSFYDVGVSYDFGGEFTQTETFRDLLASAEKSYCAGFTSAANDSANSIDTLIRDFTEISLLSGGKGPPSMMRVLTYTTGDGRIDKVTITLATSPATAQRQRDGSTPSGSKDVGVRVTDGSGLRRYLFTAPRR
jgi:hypothetical protein